MTLTLKGLVHIKKLEVYGFKSFGFRNTIVHFEKGLVAITGPNGSGKSNILDAIMFAIGENSPKAMRVDKFQSLFHDANNPGHRLIRVSVTFDNLDRGIPMDEDSVTLTREMDGQGGESQYLLNGKKVSKTAIMELLEVVLSAPNKLNIVQQGMITRISELNSDERRRIIEDIVGLSYFDEKKAEALKQLDEADRRLEVAFARMGEIRKRIDELEAERNDQLRYEQLGSELKRFKAVQLSNNILVVRNKLATSSQILTNNNARSSELTSRLDTLSQEIEKLETEKAKFIQEVDATNKAKAQLASKTAAIVYDSERTKAMLGESQRRILDVERRLPQIEDRKRAIMKRMEEMKHDSERMKAQLGQKREAMAALQSRLNHINTQIEDISLVISRFTSLRQKIEGRLKRVVTLRNSIELSRTKLEERIKTITYKKESSSSSLAALKAQIDSAKSRIQELQNALESDKSSLQETIKKFDFFSETKSILERELADSTAIISKADAMAIKFEERASVAKHAMNEDFAIADLTKYPEKFGIRGIVRDLLKWDEKYERPVLAAGSEWMKAFVVDDVKSMIAIAAYAKERKLPRLRIIPLDVVAQYKPKSIQEFNGNTNIVGRVSDFVYSDYELLPVFLFSDAILVKNSSAAYSLAKQGFRAVSVDGELFESSAGSMALDFGSKISDLTKAILLGDSVEGLRDLLGKLSKVVEKKSAELRLTAERVAMTESDKMRLEIQISTNQVQLNQELAAIEIREKEFNLIRSQADGLELESDSLGKELERYKRRLTLLSPTLDALSSKVEKIDESEAKTKLAEVNAERNQLIKQSDNANIEYNQLSSSFGGIESRQEFDQRELLQMNEETERLTLELAQRKKQVGEIQIKSQSLESELRALRQQEQQIIDSSGNAYSVLQDYERKIKTLSEDERKVSKDNNILERESALLRKDISDLTSQESRLLNDLVWLGYKNLLEPMDVEGAVKELSDEYERVKLRINLRADESYVQVMEGYRGMSTRRNQLENERNSIISFVEQIVKEKKELFMDAFEKVNNDIRTTFSKLTGGNARLELENPEDLFAGGVMLLVAFPGKVARESTALSGGEKTITATVFLLALQSLKPSPFYLMDEVDAHLDAQNTDRLSKILVERSKNNQIIMVTLKDSTVAKATLIYGVYPKQGVSQVVKYRNPGQVPLTQINSTTEGN